MATGDSYRVKAADMSARAKAETNREVRTALEHLVLAYLRLAEHADRNGLHVVETHAAPPMLQQQQPQPPTQDNERRE
jgi:hypothetical protein